jgi:hypothetical protein
MVFYIASIHNEVTNRPLYVVSEDTEEHPRRLRTEHVKRQKEYRT